MVSQVPRASEHLGLDDLKIVGLECDVSLEKSVAEAFARTLGAFGRVDAVVASAGKFSLPCRPRPQATTEVT
jgi:NAD(P)-dependent dehydrogenase (short-subunit alcohol dehydrogenase family)